MEKQQNWIQLLCVQAGGAICLPVIMVGQMLSSNYGFKTSMGAIFLGNAFLLSYSLFASCLSIEKRQPTISIAVDSFGASGQRLFGCIFLCSMLGWFAIQINVIVASCLQIFSAVSPDMAMSPLLLCVCLGIAMTAVSSFGIRGLGILSQICTPLLILTLGAALYIVSGTGAIVVSSPSLMLGSGVSLVISTAIAAVIDLPTYFRHARTKKDGMIAAILLFGLVLPFVEGIGIYLGMHVPNGTILDALTQGGGAFWSLWVAGFLLLAGWTTNNTNLYSAGTNSFALIPRLGFVARTLLIGALGTFFACFGLLNHFAIVLEVMGILIASMGGVMLAVYLQKKSSIQSNYAASFMGLILGILTLFGVITVTGASVVDAFLGAGGFAVILNSRIKKEGIFDAISTK